MATCPQPKLLAQGKPRMLGGATRGWRVRLHAPSDGSNKYQVFFKAPAGDGEPWKRMLRRAASEEEERRIFAQAEAAMDTESETPAGADVRASRTIRMLGEEYLRDSIERGKQPRTMEQRESRLNAHINLRHRDGMIRLRVVARWEVVLQILLHVVKLDDVNDASRGTRRVELFRDLRDARHVPAGSEIVHAKEPDPPQGRLFLVTHVLVPLPLP